MSLRRSLAITRNELRVLRRDPSPLIILLVMPLIVAPIFRATYRATLVLAGHRGASGAEFGVPGEAVQFLFFLAPTIGFAFFREHGWNTWQRLRTSPATASEIIAGKSIPMIALGAVQLAVLFFVGFVALDLHIPGSVIGVVLISGALLVCVVALGIALTAVFRTLQQLSAVGYVGATLFSALGGALVPRATLPGWARAIGPAVPQYWAMRGYQALILDGQGIGAALLPVAVLLAFTSAFVLIALARFRINDDKVAWA
ncbi:MAG: transporter [Actinomycetia bacterium]|jgi:ABC-2 type transport system permease protein|nr:transporter [Actinomycetes bacterium]